MIVRQREVGSAIGQAGFPVVQLLLRRRCLQPALLPDGEISELQIRRRKIQRTTRLSEVVIQPREFGQKEIERPRVVYEMVLDMNQNNFMGRYPEKHPTNQGKSVKTKPPHGGLRDEPLEFGVAPLWRVAGEVASWESETPERMNALRGFAVNHVERGAHDLVSFNDGIQASLQDVGIERPTKAESGGSVIRGVAARQLIQEANALFAARERDKGRSVVPFRIGQRRGIRYGIRGLYPLGQDRHRWVGKESSQG